ncbi:hypothetical protein CRYUN_Cryun20dG0051800 [Craigia yunnanensis]
MDAPKTPLPITQEKKSRPQKDSQRKPDGISREVYALTGGLAPLMPSIDVSQLKRRPPSDEKVLPRLHFLVRLFFFVAFIENKIKSHGSGFLSQALPERIICNFTTG